MYVYTYIYIYICIAQYCIVCYIYTYANTYTYRCCLTLVALTVQCIMSQSGAPGTGLGAAAVPGMEVII